MQTIVNPTVKATQLMAGMSSSMAYAATKLWNASVKKYDNIFEPEEQLEQLFSKIKQSKLPFQLGISDSEIRDYAERTANEFRQNYLLGCPKERLLQQAADLGLNWRIHFAEQIENDNWEAIILRLQCKKFWNRFFTKANARESENIYRKELNWVNTKKQLYVSNEAVKRRREQKRRNAALMEIVTMINELGQEFKLSELVAKSTANPAIRRAELMTRIAGFEELAIEQQHCGEFITITCPSRYHRSHHLSGEVNHKYDGSTPREASEYLGSVWGRIQAALAREDIHIYGFRVAEPHHDGCPHWHGLFFMDKAHRNRFRSIVARHAVRDSRMELGLRYFETKQEASNAAREIQQKQKDLYLNKAIGKVQTLFEIINSLTVEADYWDNATAYTYHQVSKRVDFKAINWKRGTAAGYIAKYIAKNIDGKNNMGESLGMDYESSDGANVIETAERVDAWASVWGIRQFQQVGGAPVGVWRELRRDSILTSTLDEVMMTAALAADSGDWGKFVVAMGGVNCKRADRPIQLYKEHPNERNAYNEPRDAVVKGVVSAITGEVKISRVHEWVGILKGSKAAPWTGVNNSTKSLSIDLSIKNNQEIVKNRKEMLTKDYEQYLQKCIAKLQANDEMWGDVKEIAIEELKGILAFEIDKKAGKHTKKEIIDAMKEKAWVKTNETEEKLKAKRNKKEYLALLDTLSPRIHQLMDKPTPITPPKPIKTMRIMPEEYDSVDNVLDRVDDMLKDIRDSEYLMDDVDDMLNDLITNQLYII